MTRGRTIAFLLVATGLCTASPAWAAPAIPEPVQFERPVQVASASAAAYGRRTLSGTVRTGRHFNVVGLRWRGDAVASLSIRVRTRHGWGRWTDVPVEPEHGPDAGAGEPEATGRGSDPVWAGEANAVQYRLRGSPVSAGRLRDL